jgi:hypothetical protein
MRLVGIFGLILYFLVGFVQAFAIMKGVEIWFGVGAFFAFIIAIFLTYIPIVGLIAGVKGAAQGWGWSYLWAILLFGWPYVVYIVAMFLDGLEKLYRKDSKASDNDNLIL